MTHHQFKNIYYIWSAYRGPLPIEVHITDDVCSYKYILNAGQTYLVYKNKKYLFSWQGFLMNKTKTGLVELSKGEIDKIEKLVAKWTKNIGEEFETRFWI